jgi:phosphohistidine phosphatase
MDESERTLVVIRHAKAEQVAANDYDRELSDSGRADAAALGAWLAGVGVTPDHALVSAAPRAVQTWNAIADGAGWSLEPDLDEGLYTAGPDTALDLVRAVPESCDTLIVVGHNPTMASLAQLIDDGEGDDEAGNEMAVGFPTSTAAVFAYDGAWTNLEFARLTAFHVGRG